MTEITKATRIKDVFTIVAPKHCYAFKSELDPRDCDSARRVPVVIPMRLTLPENTTPQTAHLAKLMSSYETADDYLVLQGGLANFMTYCTSMGERGIANRLKIMDDDVIENGGYNWRVISGPYAESGLAIRDFPLEHVWIRNSYAPKAQTIIKTWALQALFLFDKQLALEFSLDELMDATPLVLDHMQQANGQHNGNGHDKAWYEQPISSLELFTRQ